MLVSNNMKSPRVISTRLSGFRFSLASFRSPVSPLTPQTPKFHRDEQGLPTIYSASQSSSPTATGSPDINEKCDADIAVTIVDDENTNTLRSPTALPTVRPSPITPWHATFHRHAATSEQETAYLKRTAHLRYARLTLSVVLFAAAVSTTGLESEIIARYNRTHLSSEWSLSLWPTDINLKPTLLALTTGSLVTLLSLVAAVLAIIPGPNPRTKLNNVIFTLMSFVTVALSLTTLILSAIISPAAIFSSFISSTITSLVNTTGPSNTVGLTPNGNTSGVQRETIQSFTCAISNTAKSFNNDASILKLPTVSDSRSLVPSGFARICGESRAGLALIIVVLILSSFGLVLSAWTWAVERRIERLRGEREVIASRTGSRDFKIHGSDIPESLVSRGDERAV